MISVWKSFSRLMIQYTIPQAEATMDRMVQANTGAIPVLEYFMAE